VTAPLFFVDDDRLAEAAAGDVVVLGGPEGRHAAKVRRLGVGERVDLSDGAGVLCAGKVDDVVGNELRVRILERVVVDRWQPLIVVVQALAKGDRDERAVEVMTEVGVDEIVPWAASRSIVRWDADKAAKGVAKWRSVAHEAAKQARRPWLPDIAELATTDQIAARLAGAALGVVLHEAAERPLTGLEVPSAGEVVVVVGPEGGISDDELIVFEAAGASAYRLGASVLRTSTAGVVAAAVLSARSGRWS
jgi:16S rRNA (uracil1498-N3)-methyltransferase